MDFAAILLIVIAFVAVLIFVNSYFTVRQQSCAIVERFGRYVRTAPAGLRFKIPFIDSIVKRISLRVQQLLVEIRNQDGR